MRLSALSLIFAGNFFKRPVKSFNMFKMLELCGFECFCFIFSHLIFRNSLFYLLFSFLSYKLYIPTIQYFVFILSSCILKMADFFCLVSFLVFDKFVYPFMICSKVWFLLILSKILFDNLKIKVYLYQKLFKYL